MAAFTLNRVPSKSVLVLVGADGRTGKISPVREALFNTLSSAVNSPSVPTILNPPLLRLMVRYSNLENKDTLDQE